MWRKLPRDVGPIRFPPWSPDAVGDDPAQAIIVLLPKALAGQGTARQLTCLLEGLAAHFPQNGRPFHYVGPAIAGSEIPQLASPLATISGAQDVVCVFQAVAEALVIGIEKLIGQGFSRLAIVTMGYTAFGPEGVKRARDYLHQKNKHFSARVLVVDSAFPDTDQRSAAVNLFGWPTDRFHQPSYASDADIDVFFFITSAHHYPPQLVNERAPDGLKGVSVISPPYARDYVDALSDAARRGREEGLEPLYSVPNLDLYQPEVDLLVPVVSSDIWDPGAVGQWMTTPEYLSCARGTTLIFKGLALAAQRLGKRIFIPIDQAGADFVQRALLHFTDAITFDRDAARGTGLAIVCPYANLPQELHARLLGAADLAVSRTGAQANSTVVLALGETPNLVLDMPALNYMQSRLTSAAIELDLQVDANGRVGRQPHANPMGWQIPGGMDLEEAAALLIELLGADQERARRAAASRAAYERLRGSEAGNLFAILAAICGLPPSGALGV